MHTTAYLFFSGNCAEALSFYEKAIGATIDYTMIYGSSPAADHVPAAMHDKIINAAFHIGETQLMASDGTAEESSKHAGFAICISVFSVAEAEKIFTGLSDGATITMALAETFFAERFGQLVDRFGVSWMVIFEKEANMSKITPFLWYDKEAEEAAHHYVSIFPHSKIVQITHYGDGMPQPKGSVMTVAFELDGQPFVALNGGPNHPFTHAVSFVVNCETQAELDSYWEKLSAGGKEVMCGWLVDKYGLSWQITPANIGKYLDSSHPAKVQAYMQAMMGMVKLDIAALEKAYEEG